MPTLRNVARTLGALLFGDAAPFETLADVARAWNDAASDGAAAAASPRCSSLPPRIAVAEHRRSHRAALSEETVWREVASVALEGGHNLIEIELEKLHNMPVMITERFCSSPVIITARR